MHSIGDKVLNYKGVECEVLAIKHQVKYLVKYHDNTTDGWAYSWVGEDRIKGMVMNVQGSKWCPVSG